MGSTVFVSQQKILEIRLSRDVATSFFFFFRGRQCSTEVLQAVL